MIRRYIKGQMRKYGTKELMLKMLEMIAKYTPSKKDDKMIADIKKIINKDKEK